MSVTRHTKRIVVTAAAMIMVAGAGLWVWPHEPAYKGLAIHEWLQRPLNDKQSHEALVVLGTNNLPLLLKRIAYDPQKDKIITLYRYLPRRIARSESALTFASRGMIAASDAQRVLFALGPGAATALPRLLQIAAKGGKDPAARALWVLNALGDEAQPAMIGLARYTNHTIAAQACFFLGLHTNSPAVRQALTNALASSDPQLSKAAADALAGTPFE
jgi:hypothetical protein